MSTQKGLFGHEISKYINKRGLNPLKQPNENAFSQSNMLTELRRNAVGDLTDASNHVQRVERDSDSEPDIRWERIYAIRREIESGAYKVNYDKIAENVLDIFIDEMSTGSAIPSNVFFVGCTGIVS